MASIAKKRNISAPPKDQPNLARPQLRERLTAGSYLFLAFFIPFIFMLTAFALAKVAPFGENTMFVTDLFHQYFPFLSDYHSKLQSGGSLLWTWASGGGTNYLGLMAYYLASPLNLLSVFFPAEALSSFVTIETCVKIGLAGLFFALFLRITFKKRDISIVAFGIMYALCAFIMGYYWNIIWLDTVALLPLVVAGTFALLREGKFRLYIISLALAVLANYYMGLFVCVFVVLVSVGYTIVEWNGWRKTLRDFFKMLGCSIVSIMISALLTLPAYFALGYSHASNNSFPQNFSVNMGGTADLGGVLSGFGKTISNTLAFVMPTKKEGLPNVYCGVFVIFLAILFLFCSKIKKRERFYCLGLLVFFMLSFVIRQLDYIWHGFHFPNMLPHRFSFLFSFVLIYMAFRVFTNLDSLRPIAVLAAICCFVIYLGIASIYYHQGDGSTLSTLFTGADGETGPDPVILSAFFGLLMAAWVLLYSFRSRLSRTVQAICSAVIGVASAVFIVIFADAFTAMVRDGKADADSTAFIVIVIIALAIIICAVFYLLYSKQFNAKNRALQGMVSVILVALALTEGLLSAASGVKTVGTYGSQWYPLGTDDTLSMVDRVKFEEDNTVDLYRTELNRYHTLNDPTLIGVNGISMFSSMVNSNITEYFEKFGICGWVESNRYTYQESSPFTNMMLNIKYLISYDGKQLDHVNMSYVDSSGSITLMKNKYYIPMGFMVNGALLNYNIANLPKNDPIGNQNYFFRLSTGIDEDLYKEVSTTVNTSSEITATAPCDGIAVAYITANDSSHKATLSITPSDDSRSAQSISMPLQRPLITMMGDVKAGDTISCTGSSITGRLAIMDEDMFKQAYDLFSGSALRANEVTDTYINGNITAAEDGLFYTSIPYIAGWKAYVDGKEVEITPVGGAMVAFKLSKGSHIVELKYSPEGYPIGLIVTILGLLILIAMWILSWRRINLLDLALARIAGTKSGEKKLRPSGKKESEPDFPSDPDESGTV